MSDLQPHPVASVPDAPLAEGGWLLGYARFTAFTVEPVDAGAITWWKDLVGSEPEERTARLRQGELEETGPFASNVLALKVTPLRIDWTLSAPVKDLATEAAFPHCGEFPEACAPLVGLLERWLGDSAPPLKRLAYAPFLLRPTPGRQQGYRLLSQYLAALRIDPEGSRDLQYGINRPRDSRVVAGLQINRLSQWSVMVLKKVFMQMEVPLVAAPSAVHGVGQSACRAELDINTSADFAGELPRAKLPDLFCELRATAVEISEKGDVK